MRKNKEKKYSPVSKHRRFKSSLKTPLSQLDISLIDWERDLLPEHLWIESLAQEYMSYNWNKMYNEFIDKLEQELEEDLIILGFISDFGFIPEKSRVSFITKNKEMIYNFFFKPIGKLLSLYPDNPANWLILDEWLSKEKVDFEVELSKAGRSILRLLKAKDLYTGHLRAIPLNRLFSHDKLFYTKNMSIVDLLPKYPEDCNEDEKYHVQSHARMAINMYYLKNEQYIGREWPKYFWRHNYNLTPCQPSEMKISSNDLLSKKELI